MIGRLLWWAFSKLPSTDWRTCAALGRAGLEKFTGGLVECDLSRQSLSVTYTLPSGRSYLLSHRDLTRNLYDRIKGIARAEATLDDRAAGYRVVLRSLFGRAQI